MSKHGDIGTPGRHRFRLTATMLLLPLALLTLWAVSAPFLRSGVGPATRVAAAP